MLAWDTTHKRSGREKAGAPRNRRHQGWDDFSLLISSEPAHNTDCPNRAKLQNSKNTGEAHDAITGNLLDFLWRVETAARRCAFAWLGNSDGDVWGAVDAGGRPVQFNDVVSRGLCRHHPAVWILRCPGNSGRRESDGAWEQCARICGAGFAVFAARVAAGADSGKLYTVRVCARSSGIKIVCGTPPKLLRRNLGADADFCGRAEAFVVGVTNGRDDMHRAFPEAERVVSARIGRQPQVAEKIFAVGREVGKEIFVIFF